MSVSDDFHAIVGRLRGWGFTVTEWSGCYGRSNGLGWNAGKPVGHINHHYVCSLNPDQGYINGLVGNLANGSVVNWFADVHGVAYLIGTGPMNHSGTGNSSVLNRTKSDQAPSGPAGSSGDMTGNTHYSGTECQHPGDSTPWPDPLLNIMVAINAAEFLQWGYTANRAINHYEWTNRKIDMSWLGGPSSGTKAGNELRSRVAARMTGAPGPKPPEPTPEPEDDDVYLTYQPDAGPDSGGIWIAGPGFCEVIPSMEYYDTLVAVGAAKTVKVVSHRQFDILKDSYRRFPHLTNPADVWNHALTSMVTDAPCGAGDMLAYTNLHTEPGH